MNVERNVFVYACVSMVVLYESMSGCLALCMFLSTFMRTDMYIYVPASVCLQMSFYMRACLNVCCCVKYV